MPDTAPQVTVVTVAYNSFDVLPDMATSLPQGVPLVIVDNTPNAQTGDPLDLWAQDHGYTLIRPGQNLGFGAACNLGADAAQTPFVFFLNPDARLAPDTLPALLDAAARHPDSPAFGPAILKETGEIFRVNASRILARRKRVVPPPRPDAEVKLHSLNGAAIFARASAFRDIGGFDPEIFLYFEDDDMTLRLSAAHGLLTYVPQAHVTHASGGSTPPSPALARFKGYHFARSQARVMAKHGRRLPYLRGILTAARRLMSIRNLTNPEKWNDARGRWRGAWSMVLGTDPRP